MSYPIRLTDAEIREYWGASLCRCSPAIAAEILTTDAERRFLCEVGLPANYRDGFVTFEFGDEVLRSKNNRTLNPSFPRYLLFQIGMASDIAPLCIDGRRDGAFVCLDPDEDQPAELVNSTTRQFLLFLTLHDRLLKDVDQDDDETFHRIAHELNTQFQTEDSAAMGDLDMGFWPTLIEELLY